MPGSLSPAVRPDEPVRPGDYLTDGRELYCVEEVREERLLIEDCRQEALIEIGFDELLKLEPVRRSAEP